MIRLVGERDPATARAALEGLAKYERASREGARPRKPVAVQVGPAVLRDHGGSGPPAILVPSLINPPDVLDLDEDVSLASAVAQMGRRSLLLDWGAARERAELDVGGHVESLLVPLIAQLDEAPALIGYCLGGTMAIAAANRTPVERVATIAAPWRFAEYPEESRRSLLELWKHARQAAVSLKVLPMEVLQAAFWSLDPSRTVSKFAGFSKLEAESADARRFVVLEDWSNEGEPLPLPAARELIEDFFGADLPGKGEWTVAGRAMTDSIAAPLLNCTASKDRITPSVSAPSGSRKDIAAGHVGMVVGSARGQLHRALARFLDPACRSTG
ncbi:MAG TPA: alpha/beta hydrolase [Sphingomicrobium sp.]